MKFKIGDKIKIIGKIDPQKIWCGDKYDSFIGKEFFIIDVWYSFSMYQCYKLSGQKGGTGVDYWFPEASFELVNAASQSAAFQSTTQTSCPRCNGKLIKKTVQEPFTGKDYTIDKCQSCGWC
jgi:hypothetical protein